MHAGICNIISYAQKITSINNVRAVIGGCHLKHNNRQTQETIKYLKQLNVPDLYPSHCTNLEALALFVNKFGIKQLKTGMQLVLK